VAGVCANEEVAITVANRIVINDVKVFMAACCQLSVAGDKCETNQEKQDNKVRFGEAPKPSRRGDRSPEDSRG
jgi:hypothetical protein